MSIETTGRSWTPAAQETIAYWEVLRRASRAFNSLAFYVEPVLADSQLEALLIEEDQIELEHWAGLAFDAKMRQIRAEHNERPFE